MFESWVDTFRRYRRERFPVRVFALVAAVLTLAAFVKGIPHDWFEILLSWMASVFLLFQFRVWDDLGDRNHDAVHHPDRVLSRCHQVSAFYLLVAFTGLSNWIVFRLLGHSAIPFLLICVPAFFWYMLFDETSRRSIAGRHVLLLKYPAFVWLIAPSHPPELISSMAIVYLSGAIYELLHDREIRSRPQARLLVAIDVCALGGIAAVVLRILGESL